MAVLLVSALLSAAKGSLGDTPSLSAPLCMGKPVTQQGTSGIDNLVGTPGRDVILSLGGDDRIDGRGGGDLICAGESNGVTVDLAVGEAIGAGRDRLASLGRVLGSPRKDTLRGNSGSNMLHGLAGPDELAGRVGKDTLNGGIGRDSLDGGADKDSCIGGRGADTVRRCERLLSIP